MICKRNKLSIRRQCQLLGLNRSSCYYKPAPPDKAHLKWRESLMHRIDTLHVQNPYRGSRKLVKTLCDEGYSVSRKTVQRLMREMHIRAIYPKINLSKRNQKEAIMPYLLRNYEVILPNQVWSIDITYIAMPHGHMYLTAIIDLYSRKIVGHYLSDTLDTESVMIPVRAAVATYGTPAIINSDQGCQFTSKEYKGLLRSLDIRQSMDGKSRWADNVMIERWFRSLKTECLYPNEYRTPQELRKLINDYIRDYNHDRPHQALNYETPDKIYASCFAA